MSDGCHFTETQGKQKGEKTNFFFLSMFFCCFAV